MIEVESDSLSALCVPVLPVFVDATSMKPGAITLKRCPVEPSSLASVSVITSRAAFDAE